LQGSLVTVTSAGLAKETTARSTGTVMGVNLGATVVTAKPVQIGFGIRDALCGSTITAGDILVATDDGRIAKQIATQTDMHSAITGSAFTNQPADDGVTVKSTSALDITQTVTIYGTANGAATTLVTEVVTLTGTVDVNSTVTDWGKILGIVLSAATVGDIEVSETSGGLEIVTITAAGLSAGVTATSASNAFGDIPSMVANDTTTKPVGIIGVSTAGAAINTVTLLTNTSNVNLGSVNYATVSLILTGDVEANRTVTVSSAAADAVDAAGVSVVGTALEAGTVGELVECIISPVAN